LLSKLCESKIKSKYFRILFCNKNKKNAIKLPDFIECQKHFLNETDNPVTNQNGVCLEVRTNCYLPIPRLHFL
jgi:hypothetical protein